jgi:hypothetical protein
MAQLWVLLEGNFTVPFTAIEDPPLIRNAVL